MRDTFCGRPLIARYINLRSRPDRRDHMEAETRRVGLTGALRHGAFRPEDIDVDPARIKGMLARPQKGAIGCHFSQVDVMKLAGTERNVLVLEDDVVFCDDLEERLGYAERFLEGREWDVFSLAGTVHIGPAVWHAPGHPQLPWCDCTLGRDAETTDDPRMLRMYGSWFTFGYLVNGASVPRILQLFEEHLPASIGIDHLFIGLGPQLNIYAFTPGCAKQYDNPSDIGTPENGQKPITRFSGFASLGPYWWAPRMEDFDPTTFDWKEAQR